MVPTSTVTPASSSSTAHACDNTSPSSSLTSFHLGCLSLKALDVLIFFNPPCILNCARHAGARLFLRPFVMLSSRKHMAVFPCSRLPVCLYNSSYSYCWCVLVDHSFVMSV